MNVDSYRFLNRILVIASIALACAIFAVYCRGDWVCPSIAIANVPCVLCGCTRDFIDIYKGNTVMRNPISIWLFCIVHVELAWRLVFSFVPCRKRLVVADAVIHGVMAVLLLIYLIVANPVWGRIMQGS